MMSGYPTSTNLPWVVNGPSGFGVSQDLSDLKKFICYCRNFDKFEL